MKKNFSSPLGDGLVHKKNQKDGNSAAYFRPRVGMGWFTGFNPERFQKIAFFRPRVGMGWFLIPELAITCERHFRPRLGMGWFITLIRLRKEL